MSTARDLKRVPPWHADTHQRAEGIVSVVEDIAVEMQHGT